MRLKVDLGEVRRCALCKELKPLQRHHRRHQALFVALFAHKGSKKYRNFKARYEAFRPEDVTGLCGQCHKTVHEHYHVVIEREALKSSRPMWAWSWKQANQLMNKLEERFFELIEEDD